MGKFTDEGLKGSVGGLVYYTMKGNTYVRTKPGRRKKKRSAAEKKVNERFGTVSTYGSALLRVMKPSLRFTLPLVARNRFRSWMYKAYTEYQAAPSWNLSTPIGMCQLNPAVDLRDCFFPAITVTDRGRGVTGVNIAAFVPNRDMGAPPQTRKVILSVLAASSSFLPQHGAPLIAVQSIPFNYNGSTVPAQELQLAPGTRAGEIAVVAIAIEYLLADGSPASTDLRWLPAAAIAMGRMKN